MLLSACSGIKKSVQIVQSDITFDWHINIIFGYIVQSFFGEEIVYE